MTVVSHSTYVSSRSFVLVKMVSHRSIQFVLFLMILLDNSSKDNLQLCYSCQDSPCEMCSIDLRIEGDCRMTLCSSSLHSTTTTTTTSSMKSSTNIKEKSISTNSHRLSNEKAFSNRIVSISNLLIFVMPLLLVLLL